MSSYDRLSTLRDKADLAELEILTATPDEVISKLNPGALTVGQLLVVADLFRAYAQIRETAESVKANFPTPASAERRFRQSEESAVASENTTARSSAAALFDRIRNMARPDENVMVPTVNGPISVNDIPRDEDGLFDSAWVDENCNCPDHQAMRKARDNDDERSGLYL